MKASEMANEELAGAVESIATRRLFAINEEGYLREAAARLRNADTFRAKLKVAEDALKDALKHVEIRKNNEYDDSEVVAACDSTIAKCDNALAAIREEGGVK